MFSPQQHGISFIGKKSVGKQVYHIIWYRGGEIPFVMWRAGQRVGMLRVSYWKKDFSVNYIYKIELCTLYSTVYHIYMNNGEKP